MSETHRYVCEGAQHNKFWQYTLDGNTVVYEYGRIGGSSQTQTKTHPTPAAARRQAEQKAYKKMNPSGGKEPYVLVDAEALAEKTETAQALGQQYKINNLQFIELKDGNSYDFGDGYDSAQGVFVEILNSWTKEKFYLRVTRTEADQYHSATYGNTSVQVGSSRFSPEANFVQGVRTVLQRLMEQIAVAIETVTLGAVGHRTLDLGDGLSATAAPTKAQMEQVVKSVASSTGVAPQAVAKLAALGARSLDL